MEGTHGQWNSVSRQEPPNSQKKIIAVWAMSQQSKHIRMQTFPKSPKSKSLQCAKKSQKNESNATITLDKASNPLLVPLSSASVVARHAVVTSTRWPRIRWECRRGNLNKDTSERHWNLGQPTTFNCNRILCEIVLKPSLFKGKTGGVGSRGALE